VNSVEKLQDRYLQSLLEGDRRQCRFLLSQAKAQGIAGIDLLLDVIWICMERVSELFRSDRIDFVTEHQATRINRALADQMQAELPQVEPTGQKAIVCCSDVEGYELGAQIVADLFEADGWEVRFVGSGVPMDELLQLVGQTQPKLLIYFGTEPGGIPEVRRTLQMLHRIGASPHTVVLASGGVFNRAEGLWIEVGGDAFAPDARSALARAREGIALREHPVAVEGRPKRRRRRGSGLISADKG
jgi:methanogenic corrinoid protein MtbC1